MVEIIGRRGEAVALLVDNLSDGPEPSALGPVVSTAALPAARRGPVVVPLTTPGFRHTAAAEARTLGATSFPCLVDPTSTVARGVRCWRRGPS